MIDADRVRDLFAVAAVFGVFGFAWAGWGQEAPPARWRLPLGVCAVLSLLVGVAGGVLTGTHWSAATALDGPGAGRFFGFVVALELVLAIGGALVLVVRGRRELIAPWISIVVGVHFVPLVVLFANLTLLLPTVALVASAALAVRAHRRRRLTPSAVTAVVNGPVLLLTAAVNLVIGLAV